MEIVAAIKTRREIIFVYGCVVYVAALLVASVLGCRAVGRRSLPRDAQLLQSRIDTSHDDADAGEGAVERMNTALRAGQ